MALVVPLLCALILTLTLGLNSYSQSRSVTLTLALTLILTLTLTLSHSIPAGIGPVLALCTFFGGKLGMGVGVGVCCGAENDGIGAVGNEWSS